MRFEKPKKSGRPDFVSGRIAELKRRLETETNETRRSEIQAEVNEWQATQSSRPKNEGGRRR